MTVNLILLAYTHLPQTREGAVALGARLSAGRKGNCDESEGGTMARMVCC